MIPLLKILIILIVVNLKFSLWAAVPSLKSISTESKINKELNRNYLKWLKEADLKREQVSFSLLDLSTMTLVDNYNDRSPFIPASLTKVFTSLYALSHLGSDYRFQTKLYYSGFVKDSTLKGDIYLVGQADPLLTHAKLFNLVLALKDLGINKVEGGFYYDDSFIKKVDMISIIGLGDQTYNPSVSALSSEYNRFTIWNHKGKLTPIPPVDSIMISQTREKFDPGREFKYIEDVKLPELETQSEEVLYGVGKDRSLMEHWQLSRHNRYSQSQDLPLRKPSLFTASSYRFLAKKVGVEIPFPQRKELPRSAKELASIKSPPLHEIVRLTLEFSNNFMAETLLLAASRKATGEKLELKAAANQMQIWLKAKFPTVKWDDIYLINGSGLTSANTLNSHELTQFFARNRDASFQGMYFWSLLSISGKTGWLKKRYPSPDMSYNIWAKTGSVDYVNNIGGYLFAQSGKQYAFSILINDLDKRKIVDGDNSQKVERYRQKATGWKRETNSFHNNLLEHWVRNY